MVYYYYYYFWCGRVRILLFFINVHDFYCAADVISFRFKETKRYHFNAIKKISDDISKCDIVTAETVEQLITEIGKIKTQMNNTELQLYEANEKIAELIENVCVKVTSKKLKFLYFIYINELQHQHLKEENESLRVENSNLTKVAKLMTNSMKESMDTSKR